MATGMSERAQDQRALEFAPEAIASAALSPGKRLRQLSVERLLPIEFAVSACGRAGRRLAYFRRQVRDVDALPRRHYGDPVTDILELAHVAWEWKSGE